MAYNPQSAIEAINRLKKAYSDYDTTGDTTNRDKVASDAKKYYDELVTNGAGNIADKLHNSNYDGGLGVLDSIKSNGLQKTRDYVSKVLGKTTTGYDDNKFSFDDVNQNVSYDGINFGKADFVSGDGHSYYTPERLDAALANLTKVTGAVPNTSYGDMAKGEFGKAINNSDVYSERAIKGYDPNSEQAKAILEKFKISGGIASNGAVAEGSADNSGNIDSFAAANGLRQQKAFDVAGSEQARAEFRAGLGDIEKATNLKTGLGQTLFNNGQTENLNSAKINESIANITGFVPNDVTIKNNPYFNPDGTLKNLDIDYGTIIKNAPNEITKQYAIQARAIKTLLPKYSQFAGAAEFAQPEETAAVKQAKAVLAQNQYKIDTGNAVDIAKANISASAKKSSGGSTASKAVNKQQAMSDTDAEASQWLYSPEGTGGEGTYFYDGWSGSTDPIYAAQSKINDATGVQFVKSGLISAGYTSSQADTKIKEYKKNIANQVVTYELRKTLGREPTEADINKEVAKRQGKNTEGLTPQQIAVMLMSGGKQ